MSQSAQLELEAIAKLQSQYETELNKVAVQRKQLEESLKNNQEQFKLEQTKITQHLEEKEKAIKEAFEEITRNFELLRAALRACLSGKEEEINEFIKPILQRNAALKAKFLALNPLHIAADNNFVNLIQLLCRQGADVYSRNAEGDTPLDVAEERGHEAASQALKDILKETAVFWEAVKAEDTAAMKASLEKGAAINASLPNGCNILQQSIIDKRPYEVIRLLVEAGSDCRYSPSETVLASTPPETKGSAELKEVAEYNGVVESKDMAEARESSMGSASTSALALANDHPDWRVQDFLIDHLEVETAKGLSLDWRSSLYKKDRPDRFVDFDFPCILDICPMPLDHPNPIRFSSFVTLEGRKQFFAMDRMGRFHLVSYDLARKEWQPHLFHTNEKNICEPPNERHRFLMDKEKEWLKLHTKDQNPMQVQIMRTKEDQEQLFLLAYRWSQQYPNANLVIWRYEPNVRRWHMGRFGPPYRCKIHGNTYETEFCSGRDRLFWLSKRRERENFGGIELWSYHPSRVVVTTCLPWKSLGLMKGSAIVGGIMRGMEPTEQGSLSARGRSVLIGAAEGLAGGVIGYGTAYGLDKFASGTARSVLWGYRQVQVSKGLRHFNKLDMQTIGHVFSKGRGGRTKFGHLEDTPENRRMIVETLVEKNLVRTQEFGEKTFAKMQSNGTEFWVEVRANGEIKSGGLNLEPRYLVPKNLTKRGLKK